MEEMKTTNEFNNFEIIVSDASDHHFLDRNGDNITYYPDSVTHKRIMEEWETLEQNLPESIYVRVYKSRIDLMRAAIVGAAGTPYHNGIFFFDIAFPSHYPHNPPMVHFISFGLELSPNLHANGQVFGLGLLDTEKWEIWPENYETWDPCVSTSLRVLLSLQDLALNNPGAAMYRCFHLNEDWSRAYNQQVFSRTCRLTLQYLMVSPPTEFEAFVDSHFRNRAPAILSALKEYATSLPAKVSPEFKGWAQGFYPLMLHAFMLCGAPLDASFHNQCGIKKKGILNNVIKLIKSVD